jgi:hypothetical protein
MIRTLHAFGIATEIACDRQELFARLDERLPPFGVRDDVPRLAIRYSVRTARSGRTAVVRNRRTVVVADSLETACDWLVTDFQSEMARAADGWTFIHAGVVAIDGRAIVLPAASGGGKSTLVAALVGRGAQYASDEFAVIDRFGRVHPYARPLRLRTPGGPLRPVSACELGAVTMSGALPIGMVLFVPYQPCATFAATRLPPGSTAAGLLQHCLGVRGRPHATLRSLRMVTETAVGCAGTRGEADAAAAQIVEGVQSGGWS